MNGQAVSRASCTTGRLPMSGLWQNRSAGSPASHHPQEPGRHRRSVESDNSLHDLSRSSAQRQGQRCGSTDRSAGDAFDTGEVEDRNRLPMGTSLRSAPKESCLMKSQPSGVEQRILCRRRTHDKKANAARHKNPPVRLGHLCVGRPVRLISHPGGHSNLRADLSTRLNFMCGVRLSEGMAQPCRNGVITSRRLSMPRARVQITSIKPSRAGLEAGIWYQPPIKYIRLVGVGFSEARPPSVHAGGGRKMELVI